MVTVLRLTPVVPRIRCHPLEKWSLLARVLMKAVEQLSEKAQDSNAAVMFEHYVETILTELDKRNELPVAEMARLEWAYLPLLQHSRRKPKVLETLLARDPRFFVEVLSALYRPGPESGVVDPESADTKHAAAVATQAYRLLESWSVVPGTSDGTIDVTALKAWILQARSLAANAGRAKSADHAIGKVLAKAKKDTDGYWPPVAIREAIESTRSRELESSIITGVFNNHGITTRAPTDGGAQEREWAAFYRASAQAVAAKWLRTSSVLERIAKDYEQLAERFDQDAERVQWGP